MAFLIETSLAYGREILHGVAEYLRENEPWTIFFEHRSIQDPPPPWLRGWDGDGIIATVHPHYADLILDSGIPTVDVDDQGPCLGPPRIESDHEAIGAMAAEHLLERGLTRFAFIGYPALQWSGRRREGFEARLRSDGLTCDEYEGNQSVSFNHRLPSWEEELEAAARWIARRPKPLGIMACNDYRGVQVLDACRRADVAVPEEAAVIGVDNEVLAAELAYPPLSSVIPDCRRIGREAAAQLDHLMRGGEGPAQIPCVPPYGIATRQSTDILAIDDPLMADALRFIRERACDGINVDDVVRHVATSRSVLQRHFRATIGRTVHETIAWNRIKRAKVLLAETVLPLLDVAERAGFSQAEYMSTAFRKATGFTPAAFRREHRTMPRARPPR